VGLVSGKSGNSNPENGRVFLAFVQKEGAPPVYQCMTCNLAVDAPEIGLVLDLASIRLMCPSAPPTCIVDCFTFGRPVRYSNLLALEASVWVGPVSSEVDMLAFYD
jgi:hypothetical protein